MIQYSPDIPDGNPFYPLRVIQTIGFGVFASHPNAGGDAIPSILHGSNNSHNPAGSMDAVAANTALAAVGVEEGNNSNNNHAEAGDNCTVAEAVDKTGEKESKEPEGYRYQFPVHL